MGLIMRDFDQIRILVMVHRIKELQNYRAQKSHQ